ncbi:MAG TPA: hypothetical protein VL860_02175 [Planctomycetota bacterium]|nr:hypothetical protein [Planctomycetota bacterium]
MTDANASSPVQLRYCPSCHKLIHQAEFDANRVVLKEGVYHHVACQPGGERTSGRLRRPTDANRHAGGASAAPASDANATEAPPGVHTRKPTGGNSAGMAPRASERRKTTSAVANLGARQPEPPPHAPVHSARHSTSTTHIHAHQPQPSSTPLIFAALGALVLVGAGAYFLLAGGSVAAPPPPRPTQTNPKPTPVAQVPVPPIAPPGTSPVTPTPPAPGGTPEPPTPPTPAEPTPYELAQRTKSLAPPEILQPAPAGVTQMLAQPLVINVDAIQQPQGRWQRMESVTENGKVFVEWSYSLQQNHTPDFEFSLAERTILARIHIHLEYRLRNADKRNVVIRLYGPETMLGESRIAAGAGEAWQTMEVDITDCAGTLNQIEFRLPDQPGDQARLDIAAVTLSTPAGTAP